MVMAAVLLVTVNRENAYAQDRLGSTAEIIQGRRL